MAVRILFTGGEEPALSSMAAALLSKMLSDTLGPEAQEIEVGTAGIGARPGVAPDRNAVEVMREVGLDLMPYETQPLTPDLVEDSDLVLAMSTRHMDGAIKMAPSAIDKVFTLREFAGGRHMIEQVLRSAGFEDAPRPPAFADPQAQRVEELHERYLELTDQMRLLNTEIHYLQDHLPDVWDAEGERLSRLGEQLALFDLPEPADGSKEEYRRSREDIHLELKKLVVMLIHDD